MEKVDTQDQTIRYAIWITHKKKCFYTKEIINYSDMEVDHIIPKSLKNNPTKLKMVLKQLGLDSDFELDSLYNLVPSKSSINRMKSNDILDQPATLVYLNKIAKLVPSIKKAKCDFEKQCDYEKNLTLLKKEINMDEYKLEETYDFLADEKETFSEQRSIIGNRYNYSKKSIMFDAFLPTYSKLEVSCLIVFKTLKIRGCMITLDNKTILNQLFKGLFTDPKLGLRGVVVSKQYDNSSKYYLQLGNNRFLISLEEVQNLCDIIDDFAKAYFDRIKEIESKLGVAKFNIHGDGKQFILFKIKKNLWSKMIDFSNKFDCENGNSKWHIFDGSHNWLKVYTNDNNDKYDLGYHAFFCPEKDVQESLFTLRESDEVYVVWKLYISSILRNETCEFSERRYWNALISYEWLINEFIPYVIYYYKEQEKKKNFFYFIKKENYEDFLENFDISKYIYKKFIEYLNVNTIDNRVELLNLTECLQIFFNISDEIYLSKEDHSDLYNALYLCLNHTPVEKYGYFTGNLHFAQGTSLEEILKEITSYQKTLKSGVVDCFSIDTTLRNILVLLRDFNTNLNKRELKQVAKYLKSLVDIYNMQKVIDKYKDIDNEY